MMTKEAMEYWNEKEGRKQITIEEWLRKAPPEIRKKPIISTLNNNEKLPQHIHIVAASAAASAACAVVGSAAATAVAAVAAVAAQLRLLRLRLRLWLLVLMHLSLRLFVVFGPLLLCEEMGFNGEAESTGRGERIRKRERYQRSCEEYEYLRKRDRKDPRIQNTRERTETRREV